METMRNNQGFTVVEIVIVMGILFLLAGLGLFLSMDFYRGYSFNYEQGLVVSVLQKARSRSMSNIGEVKHGACFDNVRQKYVLFNDTNTCATSPETVDPSSAIVPNNFSIVFDQLDGAATPTTLVLSGQGKTATISINSLGAVLY